MSTDFLLEYINFLFDQQTSVTPKQMTLISSGKRTPSNLFAAEKNELQGLFNSSFQLNEPEWVEYVNTLVHNKSLVIDNGNYTQTSYGVEKKKAFITQYPIIKKIPELTYSQTRKEFWTWFIFVNQIVSEYSYSNSRYIPAINDHTKQMRIKIWLSKQMTGEKELTERWSDELMRFLEYIPEMYRHLVLDQLIGHASEGLTRRQLSQKYSIEGSEIDISITHLMQILYEKHHELPLFYSLWRDVHDFCHNGLSESAWKSMKLIDQQYSIDQVARMRKLKENTIKEHVLESVLIDPDKSVKPFIPESVYRTLIELFENKPHVSYKDATINVEFLDFFWFRLVEIERVRVMRCQQN
ncbi:MAG: helix-turn-helix domain-containing protein [Alkalibacterium sp.]|nr:helix-turn-helix domain-containing protein [Alkalibacterium sp.]